MFDDKPLNGMWDFYIKFVYTLDIIKKTIKCLNVCSQKSADKCYKNEQTFEWYTDLFMP